MNICCPVLKGTGGQATIAQANVAQPLVDQPTLVRSVSVYPSPTVSGVVQVSYGSAPLMPSLSLQAPPGQWLDLHQIQIVSDTAGDIVNWNAIYAP